MLAVSGAGLTKIAKQTGPRSLVVPEMASILWSSQAWWAFAHDTGPRVLHTLFGRGDVCYTIPQLLTFVRVEPMTAPTMHTIHLRCIERNREKDFQLAIPQEPSLSSALSIFFGEHPIPVRYDPNGSLSGGGIYKRNLAKWPVNTPDTTTVWDTNKTEIPFGIFKTLLPPSEIDPALIVFYCELYNRKAIPGRIAMVASQSSLLTHAHSSTTCSGFLDSLSSGTSLPHCERLFCALDFFSATVVFIIKRMSSNVQVIHWGIEDSDLVQAIGGALEVCGILRLPFIVMFANNPITGVSDGIP